MSRKPPGPPNEPPHDDVVVPPRPENGPRKDGTRQVREIGRVALDRLKLVKGKRGVDPRKGEPVQIRLGDGEPRLIKPGKWVANDLGLPAEHECPVIILGKDGDGIWVIDVDGELRRIEATPFGQATIQSLFGDRQMWLYWAFPRLKKQGTDENGDDLYIVDTWRAELVREVFWTAASRKGTWRPEDRIRGRGTWRDAGGRLIVHCGDALYWGGEFHPTGEIDRTFYVAGSPCLRPWSEPVAEDFNPAGEVLEIFRAFNWSRPVIDPVMMLGLVGVLLTCAALPWRAHGLIRGPHGSGKSTLLSIVTDILGSIAIFSTDTTPAGIYQRMEHEARPVVLDELEANARGDRSREIIKLARAASSEEGQMLRGGSDHKGVSFALRSGFLMAAINPPILEPQDASRIIQLTLRPLDRSRKAGAPTIAQIDTVGRRLLRILADRWGEFDRLFMDYCEMLGEAGHDQRGQYTWGVPLTLAHLMLGDAGLEAAGLPMEDMRGWIALVGRDQVGDEHSEVANWRGAIRHLFGARIDVWRGGATTTVGRLIEGLRDITADTYSPHETRKMLEDVGLGLKAKGAPKRGEAPAKGWKEGADGWWLAVPSEGDQLGRLYENTAWGSQIRAKGGWAEAMRAAPEDLGLVNTDKDINRCRINGEQYRCTLIDLDRWWKLLEEEE